jgi:hypothetical protein
VNAANNRLSACTNNLCMQAISVDAVNDQLRRVLQQRSAQSRA